MIPYKNGIPKITNLLGTLPDEVPRFITKKWIKVHDHSGTAEDRYKPSKKKKDLKHHCCDQIDVILVTHILLLKELLL